MLKRARGAGEQAYYGADYDLAGACFIHGRVLEAASHSEQALPLLEEARERFEKIGKERCNEAAEAMVSACSAERGDCLTSLGRFCDAAAVYKACILRDQQRGAERNVAVGKLKLGTVRLHQRRYEEALAAYAEARDWFTKVNEPRSVAMTWFQTGRVYEETGQPEAAEDAYRNALVIETRLADVAAQAVTLAQLASLYDSILGRPAEAVATYRRAAHTLFESGDTAGEGRARHKLGYSLHKLCRFDEARQEVRRAIECKVPFGHAAGPWVSWGLLAMIEAAADNPDPAAEARREAIASYLAYRRDGGENHFGEGRLALAVTEQLLADDSAAAVALLDQLAAHPDAASSRLAFVRALQAVVAGSRDHTLAEAPELDYMMAVEILLLIETVEAR